MSDVKLPGVQTNLAGSKERVLIGQHFVQSEFLIKELMRAFAKRLKAPTASHDYTLKIVPTVYQDKSRQTKESV